MRKRLWMSIPAFTCGTREVSHISDAWTLQVLVRGSVKYKLLGYK